jgi:N-acetylmuramoyl-L-alanine amidase
MRVLKYIFLLILFAAIGFPSSVAQQRDFTIVIDPGHGGKDAGCIGKVLKEKDLNLAIGLRVGQLISANCPHVRVIYTRKTDVFITLMDRTDKANKAKADLFLSIHADAIPRNRKDVEMTYGTSVYTMGTARTQENLDVAMRENRAILLEDNYQTRYAGFDPSKPESYIIFEMMQNAHQAQSLEFAQSIQNSLVKRGKRHDRSVRQAGFYVLRTAAMPSVLVETGFISNTKEEQWMASEKGRETLAQSIYMGFVDYKKSWDSRNGAHAAPIAQPEHHEPQGVREERPIAQTQPKPEKSQGDARPSNAQRPPKQEQTPQTKPEQAAVQDGAIYYKIQFLSSPKKLQKGAAELKGLWPVEYYKDGNVYRYTYGKARTKDELQQKILNVRKKFKDAFVAKFDEQGKRIR